MMISQKEDFVTYRSKKLVLVYLVIVALFISMGARNASSVIAKGRHDLSVTSGSAYKYDNTNQTCVFCHTPHGANRTQQYDTNPSTEIGGGTLAGRFLWNRRLPSHAWQPYSSSTMNATPGNPGITSLLCLSCHDGVGAMNILLNYPSTGQPSPGLINQFGEAFGDPSVDPLNIGGGGPCAGGACPAGTGGDLRNDHPIGFNYDTAQAADSGLIVFASLPIELRTRLNLTSHNVECSTCHDPHITNTLPTGNSFLVMSNTASAMCLGCHNK